MPNATNFLRTKASMLMIALLMVFSLVGGTLNPAGSGFGLMPTAAMASQNGGSNGGNGGSGKTVDDLWGTISDDGTSVGGDLNTSQTDLGTAVATSKKVAQAITSILTVISFVSFLFCGIALALFGGAWVAVSFFWNLLSGVA